MTEVTDKEAIKAVSALLDCVGPYADDLAVDQAKVAVSYIQQSEMARKELLETLERCVWLLRSLGHSPENSATAMIARDLVDKPKESRDEID